jgi:signal transduction histidine kinase
MAKSNGIRLAKLVDDILDFEKVSSGNMQFQLRAHAVDVLIESSVNANRVYAMQFDVGLRVRQRAPGTLISVDGDRFQQVMSNLLSNAAKFSKRGGQVEIDAAVNAGLCRISVADHGCGIPVAFRSNLFERFAQADSSDRRAQGGTGLGMAIAKRLTEGMAGTLSYESEEGQGTTFHLEFALANAAHQDRD